VKYEIGKDFFVLLRCDEKNNESFCYQQIHNSTDDEHPCEEMYNPPQYLKFPFYETSSYYDEEYYPVNTTCPDGSSGCKLYCDDDDDNCVIVNAEGYFVSIGEYNFTFYEAPSMDVFEVDKCDGSHLDAPASSCGKYDVYMQPPITCMYHVKIEQQYNPLIRDGSVYDFYGMKLSNSLMYGKFISDGYTYVIRCDMKDDQDRCYVQSFDDGDSCSSSYYETSYISRNYMPSLPEGIVYDSVNYPKPTECPDHSSGCKLYCEDILETYCMIVDPDGNIVSDMQSTVTFYNPPSVDDFNLVDCDSEPLPDTVDYCPMLGTISPVLPECAFRIHSVGGMLFRRDGRFKKLQRDDDEPFEADLYFVKMGNDLVAYKEWVESYDYLYLYRFDNIYSNGYSYGRYEYGDNCEDSTVPFWAKYEILEYVIPKTAYFNTSEYPVDVECPDGTDGCAKYCDFDGSCVVVDSNGYFVFTPNLGNLTYFTDVSFDEFGTEKCNGDAIPALSSDVCYPPTSSSSTVSTSSAASTTSSVTPSTSSATTSTSSGKPQPSINPSLSAASVAKAILSVVVAAIAVALL